MDEIDKAIEQANQALGRVKILRRNRKLALRGSLPCKPGQGSGTRRATISLNIFANPEGVKVAQAKAQRLELDLNLDRFSWVGWLGVEPGEVYLPGTSYVSRRAFRTGNRLNLIAHPVGICLSCLRLLLALGA